MWWRDAIADPYHHANKNSDHNERDNVVLVCSFDVIPNSRLPVITTWLVSTAIRCAFLDGFLFVCVLSVAEMFMAQICHVSLRLLHYLVVLDSATVSLWLLVDWLTQKVLL